MSAQPGKGELQAGGGEFRQSRCDALVLRPGKLSAELTASDWPQPSCVTGLHTYSQRQLSSPFSGSLSGTDKQTTVFFAFATHSPSSFWVWSFCYPNFGANEFNDISCIPKLSTEQWQQAFLGEEINIWCVIQWREKAKRREEKYNFMGGFLLVVSTGFWESGMGKKKSFIQCQPSHHQRTVIMLVGYLNKP